MDESLIIKYFNNNCTPEEAEKVLRWLSDQGKTTATRSVMKKVWEDFKPESDKGQMDYEGLLNKIHHEVNLRTPSKNTQASPRLSIRLGRWIVRVAAVLFLPLLSLLLFSYLKGNDPFIAFKEKSPVWTEVATPAGGKANFQLPDGTMVWLNFESRLRFPLEFTGDMRQVELEGEAFFEVAHDSEIPFQVQAGGLGVMATGTEFNVLAYPSEKTIEATLVSGSVTIQQLTARKPLPLYEMEQGQHVVLQKEDKKLGVQNTETEKFTAWREGKMIFDNDPIDLVFNRLSRWYNVDFELEDPKLAEYTYTATFTDETLAQILELMELAAPIKSQIISRERQADGSFSRGKVAIRIKK